MNLSVPVKRVLARAFIIIGIACLALQAIEVRRIHHTAPLMITAMIPPVLAVLCGLYYLRQSRGGKP